MPLKVTVVRHAQTEGNVSGILQGQMDVPLSDLGKRQANKLGYVLRRENFTRVYTSDLSRAMQTLEGAKEQIRIYQPTVFSVDTRLRERFYGESQGKPVAEYKKLAIDHGYDQKPYMFCPEGGEQYEVLTARIEAFLGEIFVIADHQRAAIEHILIVSHGALIAAMMRHLYMTTEKFVLEGFDAKLALLTPGNTGITRMSFGGKGSAIGGKRLIKFECINDTNHLKSRVNMDMLEVKPQLPAAPADKKH